LKIVVGFIQVSNNYCKWSVQVTSIVVTIKDTYDRSTIYIFNLYIIGALSF